MNNELQIRDALVTAKDLIQKHGWVQGHLGNERVGFCVVGAIEHSAMIHDVSSWTLRRAVGRTLRRPSFIETWNDAPWRRQDTVMRLFDRAIKALTTPVAERRVSAPKRWSRGVTVENLNLTPENRARYRRDLVYVPAEWTVEEEKVTV